jgi:hypothetical protein
MNRRLIVSVAGVECSKLLAQLKARVVLAACVLGPFAFAVATRVQSSLPEDTLFGRSVRESGFAVPLVVLGFAALWSSRSDRRRRRGSVLGGGPLRRLDDRAHALVQPGKCSPESAGALGFSSRGGRPGSEHGCWSTRRWSTAAHQLVWHAAAVRALFRVALA